jgi:hypothetical protein
MLSNMETSDGTTPTPEDASAALRDATAARQHLAEAIVLPTYFFSSIAVAVAVQIFTTAVAVQLANTTDETAGSTTAAATLGVGGLVVFGLVAGIQLVRFRRLNGAWVGGIASRVVLGSAKGASTVHVLAMAAAIGAALAEMWWLVALCAIAGGIAYAVSGARWMQAYRGAPDRYSRAESGLLLLALALPVIGGLVLLVAQH